MCVEFVLQTSEAKFVVSVVFLNLTFSHIRWRTLEYHILRSLGVAADSFSVSTLPLIIDLLFFRGGSPLLSRIVSRDSRTSSLASCCLKGSGTGAHFSHTDVLFWGHPLSDSYDCLEPICLHSAAHSSFRFWLSFWASQSLIYPVRWSPMYK